MLTHIRDNISQKYLLKTLTDSKKVSIVHKHKRHFQKRSVSYSGNYSSPGLLFYCHIPIRFVFFLNWINISSNNLSKNSFILFSEHPAIDPITLFPSFIFRNWVYLFQNNCLCVQSFRKTVNCRCCYSEAIFSNIIWN